MRILFAILFAPLVARAVPPDSVARAGVISVGRFNFNYREVFSAEHDSVKSFELYRDGKKILSHVLFDIEADCNSKSLELGDYETSDSTVTFFSYWGWEGGCCGMPYGARKQVYRVGANGRLHLAASAIYLQNYTSEISAMKKDDAQQFMATVEKEYNATFVQGKQADDLLSTVKKRFAATIAKETKRWEHNRFGYRR